MGRKKIYCSAEAAAEIRRQHRESVWWRKYDPEKEQAKAGKIARKGIGRERRGR